LKVQQWQIWQFYDSKAGHENQSRGLIEALARLQNIATLMLLPLPVTKALAGLVYGHLAGWRDLPAPDLLIGAGHHTHLSLLAARRVRGGRALVLMRPSLPLRLFDLCLIPEHDAPPNRPNVLATRGALNRILPSATLESDQGLLLIGGPSAYFAWNDANVCQQIATIITTNPAMHWTLTTSRRTPSSFLKALHSVYDPKLAVVPVTQTGLDWLPDQLARTGQVWVTADSVSMVYEALTAGAAVGILDVPQQRASRISRGLDRLTDDGWVTLFTDWQRDRQLRPLAQPFSEAERCARWIVDRWFD
jgi:mitochondrial fission protein ELM1